MGQSMIDPFVILDLIAAAFPISFLLPIQEINWKIQEFSASLNFSRPPKRN